MAASEAGDQVLRQAALQSALDAFGPAPEDGPRALVLRTGTEAERRGRQWTGSNPPYLEAAALAALAADGWQHLLLDLPSVDRESDGGLLAGHKAWWGYPGSPQTPVRRNATITEMIVVPDGQPQGWYGINMQVAPMGIDASPSNPVLLPIV
jgi:kynurenine formamidase